MSAWQRLVAAEVEKSGWLGVCLPVRMKGLADGFQVGVKEREKPRLLACARGGMMEPLTWVGRELKSSVLTCLP